MASRSMTGPTSVAKSSGSPMSSVCTAPTSMSIIPLATSSCTKNSRAAEQRCPAESKAERTTSRITCSGSALESAIMALRPPVSAMKGTIAPRRSASARWMAQPVALEPVKATPATRGSLTSAAPTAPSPGSRCRTPGGTPASCSSWTARKAVIGVCSAGLASTGLPAASAAATWPVKMASGKFHGDDAGERPAAPQLQQVGLAGRARERDGSAEQPPRLRARSSAGSRRPRARRPARCPASCRPRAP